MKGIICFFTLLFGLPVQAAETLSGLTEITKLYPTQGGLIFNTVYKNTELSSCEGGSRFVLDINAADYNTQVSVLIAAFMAGKRVELIIENRPVTCSAVVNRFRVAR
ncbi:hypothetical protein [Rheinheimera nanhaiensis]|uniref:hypothetical protein n=1 Tax=Rheinheimera nanhaiensis TaxID=1163621 RepID=UPI0011D1A5C1|nr:hypothetical protein [Rheinheimera nanhaiensis]